MPNAHFLESIQKAKIPIAGEEIRDVWQQDTSGFADDVTAYWKQYDFLPPNVSAEARLKRVSAIAYVDGVLAGANTVRIENVPDVRGKFAFVNASVAPEFRRHYLQVRLVGHSQAILETWARENPQEELKGVAVVLQADFQEGRPFPPVTPTNQTVLIGYDPEGFQVRIKWFDHIRV